MTLKTAQEAYDLFAKDYDGSFKSKVSRAEDMVIYSALRVQMQQGKTLDLGCGTGALLEHTLISPASYLGVDISRKMIAQARAKFPEYDFTVMDATRYLSFFENTFDNVVSLFGSISYMNPDVLLGIWRALKPNGFFMLMFFNKRYAKRKTYICKTHGIHVPFKTYSEVKHMLPLHYAYGFNFTGDIGNCLPLSWLKIGFASSFTVGLGVVAPTKALFTVVMGQKHA